MIPHNPWAAQQTNNVAPASPSVATIHPAPTANSNAQTGTPANVVSQVQTLTRGPQPCPTSGKAVRASAGNNSYIVYCGQFETVAQVQQTNVWCWAACIQMIDLYRGDLVTQAEIVRRLHVRALGDDPTSPPTRGAWEYEVMLAMCPKEAAQLVSMPAQSIVDQLAQNSMGPSQRHNGLSMGVNPGKLTDAAKQILDFDSRDIVESISHGVPAMVSLNHVHDNTGAHMEVIYGVIYTPTYDASGAVADAAASPNHASRSMDAASLQSYTITQLNLVDPANGKVTVMTGSDFQSKCGYVLSETGVKRALDDIRSSVTVR